MISCECRAHVTFAVALTAYRRHEALVNDARGIAIDGQGVTTVSESEGVSTIDPHDVGCARILISISCQLERARAFCYTVPSSGGQVWVSDGEPPRQMLGVELTRLDDGDITRKSLVALLSGNAAEVVDVPDVDRLESPVTCMRLIQAQRRYLVAGDEDGVVRIWDDRSAIIALRQS